MSNRRRGVRRLAGAALLGAAVATLSACGDLGQGPGQGRLFGLPEPSSQQAPHIGNLWVGSWVAALAVGVLVWGLMGWAFIAYRRKHSGHVPKQTRYNLPLEIMYTIVPFLIVGVLFFYTVKTQDAVLDKTQTSPRAHTVDVVGQKWSWTFNYVDGSNGETVWESGTIEDTPDLYLPVNETVTFNLHSPDVIHSFWVPSFYMKMDVIPGRMNTFQATPNREGTFAGKCAELCGTYHSAMLFNVKVVSQEEFDRHLADLRARGQVGQNLGTEGQNSRTVRSEAAHKEGE